MDISTYSLIITLNVNGLNAPIKRHRELIGLKEKKTTKKTQDPSISCLQQTDRLKVREQENRYHANDNNRETGVEIIIADKTNF